MVQRVIDPQTGRDITAEYISARLKELEQHADELIKDAIDKVAKQPMKTKEIYEKTYWEIHEKLGMGSIGPATAAGRHREGGEDHQHPRARGLHSPKGANL